MMWAARFLTAVSFLAVGVLFVPDVMRLGGSGDGNSTAAAAARLFHLLSFATAWGVGLWVTFIGGIIMFNSVRGRAKHLAATDVDEPPEPPPL
ncbi:unnamed protein product, partial [Urochloa humidicola]